MTNISSADAVGLSSVATQDMTLLELGPMNAADDIPDNMARATIMARALFASSLMMHNAATITVMIMDPTGRILLSTLQLILPNIGEKINCRMAQSRLMYMANNSASDNVDTCR